MIKKPESSSVATNQQKVTVAWKTYQNEKYKFQFRHPREISFSSSASTSRYVFTVNSWANQKLEGNKPAVGLFISLLDGSGEQALKKVKDLWNRQADKRVEVQEVKIGEAPALIIKNVRTTVSDTGGAVIHTASVILNTFRGKYFYSFQCSQNGNNWGKCSQIIHSFKFIQ